jgi:hypothetical protein
MVSLVFHAYLSSTKRSFLNSFKSESSHSAKEKPDMEGKKKRDREREREREREDSSQTISFNKCIRHVHSLILTREIQ